MTNILKRQRLLVVAISTAVTLLGPISAKAAPATAQLPVEKLDEFASVFELIRSSYVSSVDGGKLIQEAINGMVSSLDPHSAYLDKEAWEEFEAEQNGRFVGIGLEAELVDGAFKVISSIDNSPAARAGIKAGDLLLRVDGAPVHNMSRLQAGKSLRGLENTEVALEVLPASGTGAKTITLMRQTIQEASVKAGIIEPGYASIRISQFRESTIGEFTAAMKLVAPTSTRLKGVILDLRDNPGGLLASAVGVAAGFLPETATVVSVRARPPQQQIVMHASARDAIAEGRQNLLLQMPDSMKTVPLVVLVNAGSASAAEIVAAALQDNKRAILVGTTTFGKGSVQEVIPLSENTGVKLTVARYYTPSGRSIQAQGIHPDIIVLPKGDRDDRRLKREADLDNHLPEEQEKPNDAARTFEGVEDTSTASEADPQFARALMYLKQVTSRQSMDETASRPEIKTVRLHADAVLALHVSQYEIVKN
jgi:carboxyl-terminal processing protease